MSVAPIEILDWAIDGSALLLSLLIAKRLLDLSVKDTLILIASTSVYVLHEMWESGMVGGGTHKALEVWLIGLL